MYQNPFKNNLLLDQLRLLTNFVSLDLLFEALFLWITFFFAKRSSMDITLTNNEEASALSVVVRNFFIALRVVLAWYRLRKRLAALDLILFIDDL